jgi:hypothetical protein
VPHFGSHVIAGEGAAIAFVADGEFVEGGVPVTVPSQHAVGVAEGERDVGTRRDGEHGCEVARGEGFWLRRFVEVVVFEVNQPTVAEVVYLNHGGLEVG